MKWVIYILMSVTFACTEKVTISEDEVGADILYAHNSFKPYTGTCIVVFKGTNHIKEQFTFRKGILHGESLAWYNNGQLCRRGSYYQGQLSGEWEFWNTHGQKTIQSY